MIKDLILKNRSYRRFFEDSKVSCDALRELIDLARLSASAANRQPLKYIISCAEEKNLVIFLNLAWAAYLKDWPGPPEGERPPAYIVLLGDKDISESFIWDAGISAQSILLGATEKGLGGCMIASINKNGLREALKIPEKFEIVLVIAIGKPKEKVVIEPVGNEGDIKYWRDKEGTHHVPKRSLEEIIIG
jgi:nitroreductase